MARAGPSEEEGRRGHLCSLGGGHPSQPPRGGGVPTCLATVGAQQRFRPQQHISGIRGRCHAGKRDLLRWLKVGAEQRFRPQQHISGTRGRCHAGKRDLLR